MPILGLASTLSSIMETVYPIATSKQPARRRYCSGHERSAWLSLPGVTCRESVGESLTMSVSWYRDYRHPLVICLVALLGTYGQTAIGILPVMVTAWIEHAGMGEAAAGHLGSATLAGMTVGLAACVVLLSSRSHAWVARLGVVMAVASDVLSASLADPLTIGLARALAGVGYGLVVATVVSWLARHPAADRCFGTFMLLQLLVFAPLIVAVPYLASFLGTSAGYVCLIVLGAASLIIVPLLNLQPEAPEAEVVAADGGAGPLPGRWRWAAIAAPAVLLVAMCRVLGVSFTIWSVHGYRRGAGRTGTWRRDADGDPRNSGCDLVG